MLALLTTSAPDEAARNRAFALFAAVSSGGASIGLLLGGLLTDVGSWRWTLFINVPIGIAVLVLARRFVDETPRRPGRFDVVGAVTRHPGRRVDRLGADRRPRSTAGLSARTIGGFAFGAALLAVLVVTERRVAHPMIQPSLLRSRQRVGGLAMMALVVGGQLSMFFLVVQYVQRVLGFGPLASGFAFLPLSLGIFAMSRVTPSLAGSLRHPGADDRRDGRTRGQLPALSTVGAGDTYFGAVFGPMLIDGLAAGLVFMPMTATILAGVEPEHAGAASGLLQTTQQLGAAVGVAVIVSVYAAGAVPGEFVPGAAGGVPDLGSVLQHRPAGRGVRAAPAAGQVRGGLTHLGPTCQGLHALVGLCKGRPAHESPVHRGFMRPAPPNYRSVVHPNACYGCDW